MYNLNESQKKAISTEENTVVVLAGAGSGKTTVLTKKISYLMLEKNIMPYNILAITFTNKAAREMKERVIQEVGQFGSSVWVMTFHSFCLKLLILNYEHTAYLKKSFTIVDESDKLLIIKKIIKVQNLSESITAKSCMYTISSAKSKSLILEDAIEYIYGDYKKVYKQYQKIIRENNSLDFDDILLLCNELLINEEVRKKYQTRFSHIHVDEFQDTSKVQYEILLKLKTAENNLFVVGDIDQSIYRFRGAEVENFKDLLKRFNNYELIKLEQNYRSTKVILEAANNLIGNNEIFIEKKLWTENKQGQKIVTSNFITQSDESNFIYQEIKYLSDFGYDISEIAVLYRFNYQSRKIEEALMKNNIAYKIYGGVKFYDRMEIKDMISYIKLIYNNEDNIAFTRVINTPKRKVGEKTLLAIEATAVAENCSFFKALDYFNNNGLKQFRDIITKCYQMMQDDFALGFDFLLSEINYNDYLINQDGVDKATQRMENITELKEAFVTSNTTVIEYLNELQLFSENENIDQKAVILSTIHGVKGLEFDYVFLISMNQELFPKRENIENKAELEEERRVCYVAITRARKKLWISSFKIDYRGFTYLPSQFITEMKIELQKQKFTI